jgi:transketolase
VDARAVRRTILAQSKRANVGHIGSCLCVADILACLYGDVMRRCAPGDPDRDRFVLSKGHAALALHAVLAELGRISPAELDTFCGDESLLGVHPESELDGVDFSTGSLGQGLPIAAGAALAARLQGSSRRIFCLVSDAECNEGSVWEAAMFAAHHRLGNLTAILDLNGQQALGATRDVLDLSGMAARWEAFGWRTSQVDGHSREELRGALGADPDAAGRPHVVIARTVFGKSVSFMERGVAITQSHLPTRPVNWHYLPMSDAEYEQALAELDGAP